jgi:transposase
VAKRRGGQHHSTAFKRMVVERMKQCDNIQGLSEELGVHRRLMYKWRDQFDPVEKEEELPPLNSRESALRNEVNRLKRVLAEKTLEIDFFKGALQKIEARRQQQDDTGAKASTTKSGK